VADLAAHPRERLTTLPIIRGICKSSAARGRSHCLPQGKLNILRDSLEAGPLAGGQSPRATQATSADRPRVHTGACLDNGTLVEGGPHLRQSCICDSRGNRPLRCHQTATARHASRLGRFPAPLKHRQRMLQRSSRQFPSLHLVQPRHASVILSLNYFCRLRHLRRSAVAALSAR
jgi:hypothetical protein